MPRSLSDFRAFGKSAALDTTGDAFLETDSRWRLREVYEPALANWSLPPRGHALDVGAGFGAFALLFALAWPGWRVTCFEPDPTAHAALCANIARLGLGARIATRHVAIAPTAGVSVPLIRSRKRPAFLSADIPHWQGGGRAEMRPALPPAHLAALAPDLLKLTAPGHETAILQGFAGQLPPFVLGECWTEPPPSSVLGQPDAPPDAGQVYLPFAGSPWRLQRGGDAAGRPGLDIVVAMYNSAETILDCVDSLLAEAPPDQTVIVVDDGSTDDGAARLAARFGPDPRLRLVSKPNGGCASARNRGRMEGEASHIAFVDADDLTDPGFYANLLELARYSGAAMVQGGFQAFTDTPSGRVFDPVPPAERYAHLPRRRFGAPRVFDIPWQEVMTGQPTIWRRVYRRDVLDARNIWFPDHIRAFDDQIFQMVTAYHAGAVPARDDIRYLYRQHPGQDTRQGDERVFYSLEMYRLVLRRALSEGWSDFRPVATSFFNTLRWSHGLLREGLRAPFLSGAAELWVYMTRSFGTALSGIPGPEDLPEAFARHVAAIEARLDRLGDGYGFAWLDAPRLHPDMVRAMA